MQVHEIGTSGFGFGQQSKLEDKLRSCHIFSSLGAIMDQKAELSSTALPAPVQLCTDSNIFSKSSLPSLCSEALTLLAQSQSQASETRVTSNSTGSGTSAFSPVQPQLPQPNPTSCANPPALFKAQHVGAPTGLTDPLSLAIAHLLTASAGVPMPCLPGGNTTAMMPFHGTAAPSSFLASEFYIPQSLLPRDPATQESVTQQRREKMQRFQAKKRGRSAPAVRYVSRKKYADSRPRVKGRFVSKTADDKADQ